MNVTKLMFMSAMSVALLFSCSEKTVADNTETDGIPGNKVVKINPDRNSIIKNPLNGWVMYVSGSADPSYFDTKFYVSDLGREVYVRDYASACYIRTGWKSLNPSDGVYAWELPDNPIYKLVARAEELGLPIAFRVVVDGRDQRENTPQFVFDAGAQYWLSDSKYPDRKTPLAIDPIWRQYYEKFVVAFAKRFNNPETTAFIDAYGLGKWGEGHNVCYEQNNAVTDKTKEYKAETMQWITKLYADNFTEVPLVINYHRQIGHPVSEGRNAQPDSETVLEIAINNGYCLRSDAIGMNNQDWGYNDWERAFVAKWNYKVPVLMEGGWIVGQHSYWNDEKGYRKGHPEDVRAGEFEGSKEAKVNTMDFRVGEETRSWFENAFSYVQRFNSEGGYRLYPVSVSVPVTASLGEKVKVSSKWTNMGWGYCPTNLKQWNQKYKMAVALLNDKNEPVKVFVNKESDLSKWLKGEMTEYTQDIDLKGIAVGGYTWAVGLVDTTKDNEIGIRMAVSNKIQTGDGWAKIASIIIE